MKHHEKRAVWLVAIVGGAAACSTSIDIQKDSAGATGHVQHSSGNTVGSTGTGAGSTGTGMQGGTGGMSSSSGGTTGSGGAMPGGPTKTVTADNDIGQYLSFTIPASPNGYVKVTSGPFFLTDAATYQTPLSFTTVSNGDCSVPTEQHTMLLYQPSNNQAHGIKTPILPGQTLCVGLGAYPVTVLGFRPY